MNFYFDLRVWNTPSERPVERIVSLFISLILLLLLAFPETGFALGRVVAVDPHSAHTGGETRVFLQLTDYSGTHISNLSEKSIVLRLDGELGSILQFGYGSEQVPKDLLVYAPSHLFNAQEQESIHSGLKGIIAKQSKEDRTLIDLGEETPRFVTGSEAALQQLSSSTPQNTDLSIPEQLLKLTQQFPASPHRKWMFIIGLPLSLEGDMDEEFWKKWEFLLSKDQITPVYLNRKEHVLPHALRYWFHQRGGHTYDVSTEDEWSKVLEQIRLEQQQEYLLTYDTGTFGNVPHEMELTLYLNGRPPQVLKHYVSLPGVWPQFIKSGNLMMGVITLVLSINYVIYLIVRSRKRRPDDSDLIGFQVLNEGEQVFSPLEEQGYTLALLSELDTQKEYRISGNLDRVHLHPHQGSFLLEDKNYKNALLINRRRIHRTVLRDNDILDVGELTLLFRNAQHPQAEFVVEEGNKDVEIQVPRKVEGPVRKGTPMLVVRGSKQEIILIKNWITLGVSQGNDIILKGNQIAMRHAKITRVGGQYKIQNLSLQEGTTVNNRRVEQRFLRDGDEVGIGHCTLVFQFGKSSSNRSSRP